MASEVAVDADEFICGRCRKRPADCGVLCDICHSIRADERHDAALGL